MARINAEPRHRDSTIAREAQETGAQSGFPTIYPDPPKHDGRVTLPELPKEPEPEKEEWWKRY